MSLKTNIVSILLSNTTVASYVGTRIFQNERPQINSVVNGLPCLVVSTISTDPYNTKSGRSQVDVVRIQIDAYSTDPEVGNTLTWSVRNALDYTGTDGSPFTNPNDECEYGSCVFEEERDSEYIRDAGNKGAYLRSIDFMIRATQI